MKLATLPMKASLWSAIVLGTIAVGCKTTQAVNSVASPIPPAQSAASVIASAPPAVNHPVSAPPRAAPPRHRSAEPVPQSPASPASPAADSAPVSSQPAISHEVAVQYVSYHSNVLGVDRTYGIALPPGYNLNSQERYPVIVLLHGGSGDQADWFNPDKGDAADTLQQLYVSGKLPPSIVVTPDGNDLRGKSRYHDPQYFDGPNGKVATALGDELVQVIQSRYRSLNQPDFWAIGGLSSGAWGAVNIGLHFPNRYHIMFSHSGYFVDSSGAANSPQSYIKTLSAQTLKPLHIYLDSGDSDADSLRPTQQFYSQLRQLNVQSQFKTFPGTHSWRYWRTHLTDSLTYVGQQFQQAFTNSHSS